MQINHIFTNEASLGFSYDYFETGLGDGPGTWPSLADDTIAVLRNQASRATGLPGRSSTRFCAVALPFRDASLSAVVTDPPYDEMIAYSDASDLFYVWLKRALVSTAARGSAFTTDQRRRSGEGRRNHRQAVPRWKHGDSTTAPVATTTHDRAGVRRSAPGCPSDDGVVTIVFGHGDPEVWHRLLERDHAAQAWCSPDRGPPRPRPAAVRGQRTSSRH